MPPAGANRTGRSVSKRRAAPRGAWWLSAPGQPDSLGRPEVDLRRWVLDDREAPELPITIMAEARRVAGQPPEASPPLWERWNDYGIGLFLEGDTREALAAFGQVVSR